MKTQFSNIKGLILFSLFYLYLSKNENGFGVYNLMYTLFP